MIDLKGIAGISSISVDANRLRIGALVTLHELSTSPLVNELCPAVTQAASSVAFREIRQAGTIGGNICQESRCWYYRYPGPEGFHCLRKGGDRCFAILGENDLHSVFGSARVGTPPCVTDCPIGIRVPDYLADVRDNEIDVAAQKLFAVNPFVAITGRVCPHFCQSRCARGDTDVSVAIRNVERYIGDYILEHGEQFFTPQRTSNGRSVAVVGSGPAGLAAAYYLVLCGCRVTVFEKDSAAGGMLCYGIPEFRLPKSVLSRLLSLLDAMGVNFRLSEEIGGTISIEKLKQDHDLVYLAPGAASNNTGGIPGEEHADSGLAFLRRVTYAPPDFKGMRVGVVGGGNVAIDCARTAVRCGAAETHLICRESHEEMPAYAEETEEAANEGVIFHFLRAPISVKTEDGKVRGLDL
ncbi:MAG: FAD-dependent oxidoreductase, partial [Spirochaetaceae bacterium]|nr:FAD-dependent oxidoreductase [Spirochaetaceae bacterium]